MAEVDVKKLLAKPGMADRFASLNGQPRAVRTITPAEAAQIESIPVGRTFTLLEAPQAPAQPTIASKLEAQMLEIIESNQLPTPEIQHEPFTHLGRKHRIDFAWPEHRIALEVQGGAHGVQHQQTADTEKLFLLQYEGWFVITATPADLGNGKALARIQAVLHRRQHGN